MIKNIIVFVSGVATGLGLCWFCAPAELTKKELESLEKEFENDLSEVKEELEEELSGIIRDGGKEESGE